jgi:hypothetical protein
MTLWDFTESVVTKRGQKGREDVAREKWVAGRGAGTTRGILGRGRGRGSIEYSL